jgi:hypothetical protein
MGISPRRVAGDRESSEEPFIDLVLDGRPGRQGVEAEDSRGYSSRIGEWLQREDGRWVLQLKPKLLPSSKA